MKKRDKKKFSRKQVRYKNIEINDLDSFNNDNDIVIEEKRAAKKTLKKGQNTQKRGLNLKLGRVIQVMSNYSCIVEIDGDNVPCSLSGRLKQLNYETRNPIAVGDYVNVDLTEITTARIEEIMERKNTLSRFSEHSFQQEIIIASNIDQVIITASYREPMIKFGFVDRFLCAAEISGLEAIICINKIDLAGEDMADIDEELDFYEELGIKIVYTSVPSNFGIDELRELLKDKESVFSGQSGVGKSTLINALSPGLNRRVSEISDYNEKGRHTTTNSKLLRWNFGGYLVDTPGIKTLALHKKQKDLIPTHFPGFYEPSRLCKFNNCTHTHEIKCEVKRLVEEGEIPFSRYESYLRILESL